MCIATNWYPTSVLYECMGYVEVSELQTAARPPCWSPCVLDQPAPTTQPANKGRDYSQLHRYALRAITGSNKSPYLAS